MKMNRPMSADLHCSKKHRQKEVSGRTSQETTKITAKQCIDQRHKLDCRGAHPRAHPRDKQVMAEHTLKKEYLQGPDEPIAPCIPQKDFSRNEYTLATLKNAFCNPVWFDPLGTPQNVHCWRDANAREKMEILNASVLCSSWHTTQKQRLQNVSNRSCQ